MIHPTLRAAIGLLAALLATAASPWGAEGHRTVGALADRLIAGTPAQAHVRALLGELTLAQAAVWADCAKGVDPARGYAYVAQGKYPECAPFETPAGQAAMIDFVRRNDEHCPRDDGAPPCHVRWHYTDVAIQRTRYRPGDRGTRDSDIVAATTAAIHVLQGRPAAGPFRIKDQREALLLLAHLAGDIAQPLHVGVVSLGPCGELVDPPGRVVDPATDTQGGNRIATIRAATNHRSESLHATWDDLPATLHADRIDADWLALARAQPPTPGAIDGWATQWADDSLAQARRDLRRPGAGPAPLQPVDARAGRPRRRRDGARQEAPADGGGRAPGAHPDGPLALSRVGAGAARGRLQLTNWPIVLAPSDSPCAPITREISR